MKNSTKVLSGVKWSIIKIILVQVINFGAIAILSRQLDPSDFGIVALANVALKFFNTISANGISQFIIYDNSVEKENKVSSAFWLNVIFAITTAAIGMLSIQFIEKFYEEPLLGEILFVLLLRYPIDIISKFPDAILQKKLDFRSLEIRDTSLQFLTASFSVIMALMGFGVWSLVIPSLIIAPIRLLVSFSLAKWLPSKHFHFKYWIEILRYSSSLIGSSIMNFLLTQGDTLMVGKLLSSNALGIYNLSWQGSNLISRTIVKLTNKIAFPVFSMENGNKAKIISKLDKILYSIGAFSFPILFWMIVAAENIVLTVYGAKWVESILPLQILLVYAIRYSIGAPLGSLFKGLGRPDIILKVNSFIIPFYFTGIWFGSKYGIIGIAISVTLVRTIFGLINFFITAKLLNTNVMLIFKNLKSPFMASILMFIFSFTIECFSKNMLIMWPPFIKLLISAIISTSLYLLFIKLFFNDLLLFYNNIYKTIITKKQNSNL
jgi:O-antigen/teichoic acid export membrane protein